MSVSFTVLMTGYLTGSILCGLIYERVNHELAFAATNFVNGLAIILAPFMGVGSGLIAFMGALFCAASAQGFIDAGKSCCAEIEQQARDKIGRTTAVENGV